MNASDPLSTLLTYGPLGVFLILILVGWLAPKPTVDDLKQARDQAEKQRDDLIATYEQQVIPALNAVAHDVLPALLDAKQSSRDAVNAFQRLQDEIRRAKGTGAP